MEREKKIYLCCRSLMNVSMDLKEDYEDFSNMILFIADKIAEHEEKREKENAYQIHGDGNIHDLSEEKDYNCNSCGDDCKCVLGDATPHAEEITEDEKLIDKEIDEMIEMVRKEVKSDLSD